MGKKCNSWCYSADQPPGSHTEQQKTKGEAPCRERGLWDRPAVAQFISLNRRKWRETQQTSPSSAQHENDSNAWRPRDRSQHRKEGTQLCHYYSVNYIPTTHLAVNKVSTIGDYHLEQQLQAETPHHRGSHHTCPTRDSPFKSSTTWTCLLNSIMHHNANCDYNQLLYWLPAGVQSPSFRVYDLQQDGGQQQ